MNRTTIAARACRMVALAIALAGAIDPIIASTRLTKPDIAIVAIDPARDSALALRTAAVLKASFMTTMSTFPAASATVLVGATMPALLPTDSMPIFGVVRDRGDMPVSIEEATAAGPLPLDSRSSVHVRVRAIGARGRKVTAALQVGEVIVDQVDVIVPVDDTVLEPALSFVPAATGTAQLRVTAGIADAPDPDRVDLAVDVREIRSPVLFYDPRASWQSTFVRRAVEGDRRFVVTSRVVTSRNVSTDVGVPPASLENLIALGSYDVIVVGAPEALTAGDVAGLEAYLRRRGGVVVLLLDQRADGPYQRLTDVAAWLDNRSGRPLKIDPLLPDTSGLIASDLLWPSHLPPGASAIGQATAPSGGRAPNYPVIWYAPAGSGRLIVSGALDAWRYRDPGVSGFDRFWRAAIAQAASAALAPLDVRIAPQVVRPGERVDISATVRDAALHPFPARTTLAASLAGGNNVAEVPLHLWPDLSVGQLKTSIRAPATPGRYQVAVAADGNHATASFVVRADARHPAPDDRRFLGDWIAAHGGAALPASRLSELPALLRSAIHLTPRRQRWHPLRSPWWLLPFTLALSGEWWLRRRRGLA